MTHLRCKVQKWSVMNKVLGGAIVNCRKNALFSACWTGLIDPNVQTTDLSTINWAATYPQQHIYRSSVRPRLWLRPQTHPCCSGYLQNNNHRKAEMSVLLKWNWKKKPSSLFTLRLFAVNNWTNISLYLKQMFARPFILRNKTTRRSRI